MKKAFIWFGQMNKEPRIVVILMLHFKLYCLGNVCDFQFKCNSEEHIEYTDAVYEKLFCELKRCEQVYVLTIKLKFIMVRVSGMNISRMSKRGELICIESGKLMDAYF